MAILTGHIEWTDTILYNEVYVIVSIEYCDQWHSQDLESGGGSVSEKVISDARVQGARKI